MDKEEKNLSIVATPIGNLFDISQRAIETIKRADIVICENPKHSLKLLNNLGIKKKLVSLHDYNENIVIQKISKELTTKNVVLISDAGSPLISDPGFKLINYCIKNNVKLTSIPGPTSIIPALQLSGMSLHKFSFLGFFPKSKKLIHEFMSQIVDSEITTIFFVSSHKLIICLDHLEKNLIERDISICKELTKINEKIFRGNTQKIVKEISKKKENLKGEFVFVIEGKKSKASNKVNIKDYEKEIIKLLTKFSLTDVVEIVHKLTKLNKNIVYKWVLNLKK